MWLMETSRHVADIMTISSGKGFRLLSFELLNNVMRVAGSTLTVLSLSVAKLNKKNRTFCVASRFVNTLTGTCL